MSRRPTRRSPIFAAAAAQWAQMKAEYDLALEAHISAAEDATRGYLLSPSARSAGVDVHRLFSVNASVAAAWASEELKDFWSRHPRPTLQAFERGWSADPARLAQDAA